MLHCLICVSLPISGRNIVCVYVEAAARTASTARPQTLHADHCINSRGNGSGAMPLHCEKLHIREAFHLKVVSACVQSGIMQASPLSSKHNVSKQTLNQKHHIRSKRVKPTFALCSGHGDELKTTLSRRSVLLTTTILPGVLSAPLEVVASPALVAASTAMVERAVIGRDLNISRILKGCWQLSGGHRGDSSTDQTSGAAALTVFDQFYKNGITTFDAADHYGDAEPLIGRWLRQTSQATGQDIRKNVQIFTKVCVFDSVGMATVNQASMKQAVDARVRRLGTSPDNIQFYWGTYEIPKYVDAAKYLAEEQAAGRFGYLGVTNFDVKRMEEIAAGDVKMASNQLQYSLLDRRPENGMVDFCQSQGIVLVCYGVLAGGLISERYLGQPPNSVKLDTFSKRKYASVLEAAGGWSWLQLLLKELKVIADKHNTNISNVACRWVLDKPGVSGIIVGARNANHVPDHVALSTLKLDDEDRGRIQEVLAKGRQAKGDCYQWERGIGPW